MDIKGLHYFIAAAERLNFTAAAKECYITQTAMSLHISKMEDELGFVLFNRNKRVVELTEAGRDFLHHARMLVQNFEDSVRQSASIASGVKGIVSLMVPSCLEGFIFMGVLRRFRDEYPDVELNVQVGPHEKLVSDLKRGKIDVGVGALYDMEIDPDITVKKLREDPVMVVCSIHHRFAKLEKVSDHLLRDEIVIMSEPSGMPTGYRALRTSWTQSGSEPGKLLTVRNLDEMLLMIELDRGIGFLPSFAMSRVDPDTSGLAYVPFESGGDTPSFVTALGHMVDNTNPVLKNFLAVLMS